MSTHFTAVSEKPTPRFNALATGLALYSMFFGAGNVVFPLILGRNTGSEMSFALLGIGISGVLFPFLGLIAMLFSGGDLKKFLSRLGKWPAFVCHLILNFTMGLFVVSRLFILMHVSAKIFFPNLSLIFFSSLIVILLYGLTYKPHRLITMLGTVLTPLLLVVLGVLMVAGIIGAPSISLATGTSFDSTIQGLTCGYQMMDLLSALVFATLIIPHLMGRKSHSIVDKEIFRKIVAASAIAAFLLMITYVGLVWVAAHYRDQLPYSIPAEELLSVLAFKLLGPQGGVISSLIVFFACLTTAMSSASIFGKYLQSEIFRGKIKENSALILALIMAAFLATLGFSKIMQMVSPLLEVLYPILIVLCLFNIGSRFFHKRYGTEKSSQVE